MRAKIYMMKKFPAMTAFVVKAFYEKDPETWPAIQKSYQTYFGLKARNAFARVNLDDFVEGLDLQMMHREMYLASEGYLWEIFQRGEELDVLKLEKDFGEMLEFWKKIYLKNK